MQSSLACIEELHNALGNLLRLFVEARKYKDLEVRTKENVFTKLMPLARFTSWILCHQEPTMKHLHVLGKNADATKTIRADFLLSELPFEGKDVGVGPLREVLGKIHKAHMKDKIGIATTYGNDANMVYLPREMEVTLIYQKSLTSGAAEELNVFREAHRRMTIVELSLDDHLRCYLLDHRCNPWSLRRLDKRETAEHTPTLPIKLNELVEDSVEVLLIGGVPGDVIESKIALKSGVNLTQYWKIIPKIVKKK